MVLATLLWGGTFVVIRDTLRAIDPLALVCTRFAIATVLLAAAAVLARARFDRAALRGGVLGGACAAGGYLFQAIGLQRTSAGTSAFLTCTGTLFAALFAWPLLGQRPSRTLAVGLLAALAGSALLAPPRGLRFSPGESWTLLGALAYALQIVAVARDAPRAHPLALVAIQSAALTVLLVPFLRDVPVFPGAADAWRIGYLVLAGSVVAPWLQVLAQRELPPGRIGLLFALEPVFALLFAVSLGGERFGGPWWAGAALILWAVVHVERAAPVSDAPVRTNPKTESL